MTVLPELTLTLPSDSPVSSAASAAPPDPAMSPRHLLVTSLPKALRWSPVSQRNSPPIPYLRLRGRWLERAGFAVGSTVRVSVEPRRLVIEVIEKEASPGFSAKNRTMPLACDRRREDGSEDFPGAS